MDRYASALILGLGNSGVAAAELLALEGTAVTAIDAADTPVLRARAKALTPAGVVVVLGAETLPPGVFDLCVVSPGVPLEGRWLTEARARGLTVMSELELGCSRLGLPMLAISGTNGKSTLTKLCCDALVGSGWRAVCAGNYGAPVCGLVVRQGELDWLVVEVSSFQLETTGRFLPEVAVLLNVQPDHLDRHGTMECYGALKARLFRDLGAAGAGILPTDLLGPVQAHLAAGGAACRWITFGADASADYRYADGLVLRPGGVPLSFAGGVFGNPVLGPAAAAAVAAIEHCGGQGEAVVAAAAAFQALPHRMEPVATLRGVRFVDDSKGTNLAAMEAALRMVEGPVHLIAGGLLKEKDLDWVQETLVKRAKGVYVIGEAAEKMKLAWSEALPCHLAGTLDGAVRLAWERAAAGDVILLSPGCASFDQYQDYKHRGEHFKRVVGVLEKEMVG